MKDKTLPTWAIFLALAAAAICNAVVWMHWDPTLIMNDGVGYLSTASNALNGNGFSTNALIYTPHFEGRLPAYETVWPIGFPASIAAASVFGISVQSTALALNLIAHGVSALLVFAILRRCGVTMPLSLTGALTFYFTTEPWFLVVAILSEPMFALLVLATLALFPPLERFSLARLILCGLLMAAATTVRYSGAITSVSFAAGAGIVCLIQLRDSGAALFLKRSLKIAAFSLIAIAGYVGLQLRIYNLSGNLDRDTGTAEPEGINAIIVKFAEQSSVMTGFRDGLLFTGDADKLAFFAFVLLVASILTIALAISCNRPREAPANGADAGDDRRTYVALVVSGILMHTLLYAGYLFYCRVSDSPLPVSARYLYQLYPGLIIVFYIAVNYAITRLAQHHRMRTAVISLHVVLLALYAVAQVNMIPIIKEITQRGHDASELLQLRNSDRQTIGDIVRQCVGSEESIWSNEGVMLHRSTGANTITYTDIYANRPFNFNAFERDIQTYRIALFVFIDNRLTRDGSYADQLAAIKEWLNENGYRALTLQQNKLPSGSTASIFSLPADCPDSAPG